MKKQKQGLVAKKGNYKLEIKYSPEAVEKELMRFTIQKGKSFEISVDELLDLVMNNFNKEKLSPVLVKNKVIHMTEVTRTLVGTLSEDKKAGEKIVIPYKHMVPYEFAVCEQALNLAKISGEVPVVTEITMEMYRKAQESIDKGIKEFTELQYSELLGKMRPRTGLDSIIEPRK